MIKMIKTETKLLEYIKQTGTWDAVIVEGYDGVGKGRVLSVLSNYFMTLPYRPDYNLWQKYDHRPQDRWKISGFFWDVYSHFMRFGGVYRSDPLIFDRGVLSGAVYNNDESIAKDYKRLLRDMKVLHILVVCTEEDYKHFAEVRKSESPLDYRMCKEFTSRYLRMMTLAGVEYVVYKNVYDESLAERLAETCEGCGHYSYGICRHPKWNCRKSPEDLRCPYSSEEEVQDRDVASVH